jgi:hypothetical protein
MPEFPDIASLRESMRLAHQEGNGIFRLHVVGPENAAGLVCDSLSGSTEAMGLLRAVAEVVARIEGAPRSWPMLCGCCPRPLRRSGFTLCVATPERPDPSRVICFALCPRCGDCNETRRQNALKTLAKIWPDVRQIAINPARGHA